MSYAPYMGPIHDAIKAAISEHSEKCRAEISELAGAMIDAGWRTVDFAKKGLIDTRDWQSACSVVDAYDYLTEQMAAFGPYVDICRAIVKGRKRERM